MLDREKRDGKSELFKSYTETQNYSNELKEEIEGQLQSQGEGTADAAFQKFKLRLHLSTQRFLDAKNNKVRPRIQVIPFPVDLNANSNYPLPTGYHECRTETTSSRAHFSSE